MWAIQQKLQTGRGMRKCLLRKTLEFLSLLPIFIFEIPDMKKVDINLWKFLEILLHPLENPRPGPTAPGNSTSYFFNIPEKPISLPYCFGIFSGIAH